MINVYCGRKIFVNHKFQITNHKSQSTNHRFRIPNPKFFLLFPFFSKKFKANLHYKLLAHQIALQKGQSVENRLA